MADTYWTGPIWYLDNILLHSDPLMVKIFLMWLETDPDSKLVTVRVAHTSESQSRGLEGEPR
jgi:hypothetical protein